ncbi:MAG: hypothetical protein Q7K57_26615 [Burkholderiaceae bacterium]|nr:hypothetical protein [Burkholderiaceae bacterium]
MNPSIFPSRLRLVLAMLAMFTLGQNVLAQEASHSQRPNPADAQAIVPPLIYLSTLQNYRPFTDQEVGSWKELNDTTARVGGWRVYAKQAREPDPTDTKPVAKEKESPTQDKSKLMDHSSHTK